MTKSLTLILSSVLLASAGQLMLKHGMSDSKQIAAFDMSGIGTAVRMMFTNYKVMVGLGLFVVSAVMWLMVLSRVDLSYAYPMVALGYAVVLLASSLLFHETVTPVRWAGVAVIILGVVLVSRT